MTQRERVWNDYGKNIGRMIREEMIMRGPRKNGEVERENEGERERENKGKRGVFVRPRIAE